MDTLTHGLSGALIGRALSKKAKVVTPAAYIVVGACAATFPDFDFIFKILGNDSYMWNHRGITHSFFFLPLWAALISLFLAWFFIKSKNKEKWIKSPGVKYTKYDIFKDIYLMSCIGLFAHIVGDLITSFGTMIFWPILSRYEYGSVFVIDLFFTGIIVTGLLCSWKFGKTNSEKVRIATIFIGLLVAYIGFTQCMRVIAKEEVIQRVYQQYPETKNNKSIIVDAKPDVFLPTNWIGIAYDVENAKYYYAPIKLWSSKNKASHVVVEYKKWGELNTDRARVVFEHPKMEFARWFMQYPYVLKEDEKCVLFTDMRYTSNYRKENPFIYGLCDEKE